MTSYPQAPSPRPHRGRAIAHTTRRTATNTLGSWRGQSVGSWSAWLRSSCGYLGCSTFGLREGFVFSRWLRPVCDRSERRVKGGSRSEVGACEPAGCHGNSYVMATDLAWQKLMLKQSGFTSQPMRRIPLLHA